MNLFISEIEAVSKICGSAFKPQCAANIRQTYSETLEGVEFPRQLLAVVVLIVVIIIINV
jgi:hypothetical protein